jgi:Lamin-B receptor of TUDOR domain
MMLLYTQAAYNNTAEFELEDDDVQSTVSSLSQFPIGTKVAKQFEGDDRQLVWFEGTIERFDEDDNLYWVLYTDGDSEDMEEAEVRDAVHNYRMHLQQDDVTVGVTTSSAPSITRVDVDMTDTTRLAVDSAAPVGDSGAGSTSQSPSSPDPSELAVAMHAMTAAAERLASAATRIETAIHTQRCERSQQPQQILSVLPNWQMHYYWQHVTLQQQQQQQQQQQWLVCYQQQQQQIMYCQQR